MFWTLLEKKKKQNRFYYNDFTLRNQNLTSWAGINKQAGGNTANVPKPKPSLPEMKPLECTKERSQQPQRNLPFPCYLSLLIISDVFSCQSGWGLIGASFLYLWVLLSVPSITSTRFYDVLPHRITLNSYIRTWRCWWRCKVILIIITAMAGWVPQSDNVPPRFLTLASSCLTHNPSHPTGLWQWKLLLN